MKIASLGYKPSKYWSHNPELKNDKNETVAIILAKNGIISPTYW